MRTPSLNNNLYFIVFVDDFSRFTWVYFAKEKSAAFTIFQKFKSCVEKQSGHSLKILRTDRGERKNKSLVEMAKSMLNVKEMPKRFWAEAIHTAAYILYHSLTIALKHKTPFEAWHGWKPKEMQGYSEFLVDDFFPNHEEVDDVPPSPQSPLSPSPPTSSSTPSSSSSTPPTSPDSSTPSQKWGSLQDIYARTEVCQISLAHEPSSFAEAVEVPEWCAAIDNEIQALKKHDKWELVDLPNGKTVIGLKWVYKIKYKPDGFIQKHKARLVARGCMQREVFVEQPIGYVVNGQDHKVCKHKKALYGLKQAPRAWYSRIDNCFSKFGLQKSASEPTL
ncbi:hypothetical protein Syun_014241 [Stephania yunnanensis]|uniref:Reverse transcriptase Ty1/copia-type domain-containing protein n=1 Tax=Stephania yunnanensis TaxID=152371 RepID=A0AAP0JK12_9MAGN